MPEPLLGPLWAESRTASHLAMARLNSLTYDLFISYRRVPGDSQWAEWLQAAIERYRLPRPLRPGANPKPGALRVFRDKGELPATAELRATIDDHLRRSRFLLVICSPAATQSAWVAHELAYFQELGRRSKILTLLVEGDPISAFPTALRSRAKSTDTATTAELDREGEAPRAVDVRGLRPWLPSASRRQALLGILAPLLDVPLRELDRRDARRRRIRLGVAAAPILVILALITALSLRLDLANELAEQRGLERDLATYDRELPVVDSYIRQGRCDLARKTLEDLPLAPRNWEWGYLRARCERDAFTLSKPAARTVLARRGEYLAFDRAGLLGIWDLETGRLAHRLGTLRGWSEIRNLPWYLRPEPESHREIASQNNELLRRTLEKVRLSTDPVEEIDLSPDGQLLAVRYGYYLETIDRADSNKSTIHIWDVRSGERLTILSEGGRAIDSMRFSPDSRQLLTVSRDRIVRLWNPRAGAVEARLEGHVGRVAEATFSPDGVLVLTSSDDQTVKIWANKPEQEAIAVPDQIAEEDQFDKSEISFPQRLGIDDVEVDGSVVRLLRYRAAATIVVKEFAGHTADIVHARFADGGKTLLTVALDGTARVWDVASGESKVIAVGGSSEFATSSGGHSREIFSALLLPDSRRLLTAGEDGLVKLWDVRSGRSVVTIDWIGEERRKSSEHNFFQPRVFRLSRDRRLIAIESLWDSGEPIRIWEVATGRLVSTLRIPGRNLDSASFSPDNTRIVTVSSVVPQDSLSPLDWSVVVWNVERGYVSMTLRLDPTLYVTVEGDVGEYIREELRGGRVDEAGFSADGSTVFAILGQPRQYRVWTWKGLAPDFWHLEGGEFEAKLGRWKEDRLIDLVESSAEKAGQRDRSFGSSTTRR